MPDAPPFFKKFLESRALTSPAALLPSLPPDREPSATGSRLQTPAFSPHAQVGPPEILPLQEFPPLTPVMLAPIDGIAPRLPPPPLPTQEFTPLQLPEVHSITVGREKNVAGGKQAVDPKEWEESTSGHLSSSDDAISPQATTRNPGEAGPSTHQPAVSAIAPTSPLQREINNLRVALFAASNTLRSLARTPPEISACEARNAKLQTLTAHIDLAQLEEEDPGLSLRPSLGKQRVEEMTADARRARRREQNRSSSQRARTRRRALRVERRQQLAKMLMTLAGLTTEIEEVKRNRKSEIE
mmetsp:Transcript_8483/g.21094  ORF Transcript_8483/g.21094 Transcript_8483/m.21094 type:complete len:299 (+) Transcript_8483:105-1001(+)